MKRMMVRVMMCLGLLAVGLYTSACSQSVAEQNLAGDSQVHERHAEGIDSQVADN